MKPLRRQRPQDGGQTSGAGERLDCMWNNLGEHDLGTGVGHSPCTGQTPGSCWSESDVGQVNRQNL